MISTIPSYEAIESIEDLRDLSYRIPVLYNFTFKFFTAAGIRLDLYSFEGVEIVDYDYASTTYSMTFYNADLDIIPDNQGNCLDLVLTATISDVGEITKYNLTSKLVEAWI